MIRFKCPECGASCSSSHCFDCDIDIPMSRRYDDEIEAGPSAIFGKSGNGSDGGSPNARSMYKCPDCGNICGSPYCIACEKSLRASDICGADEDGNFDLLHYRSVRPTAANPLTAEYITLDPAKKRFKLAGSARNYDFGDLVDCELCENYVEREDLVRELYIRLTLKSEGVRRINFILFRLSKGSYVYRRKRERAEAVLAELEIIVSENRNADPQVSAPASAGSPALVADELLKLKQLLDMGVLSQEEFDRQKRKLLDG